MCFGFDGHKAVREVAERQGGLDRRGVLRGFGAALVGGAATLAAGPALAAPGTGNGLGPGSPVPDAKISIQMYTLRSITNGTTVADVLASLSGYGYRRVELAGTYGYSAQEMKDLLDSYDISATSAHSGLSADLDAARAKFEDARTLGQRFSVVPYLRSQSSDQWRAWADAMNAEAEVARTYGLRYGYHNHAHEWYETLDDGSNAWDILTERLDPRFVHFEVDLYWAVTGGILSGQATEATASRFASDVIAAAPQKTLQYHVKDRDAGTSSERAFADVGTGFIDFPLIFGDHRVQEYIVENDQPDVDPLTTARVGWNYLSSVRASV
ncbi:sugar phosphate isomerase/epimerase family protein [Aquipuribacter nitratireducens]|uniref:Sugar phosphate isomerase/epimerase family protein n=1 Tax=Aquipuribacter nitratireducens TaxID=650104 RepID=A0ABW0GP01_9MICO